MSWGGPCQEELQTGGTLQGRGLHLGALSGEATVQGLSHSPVNRQSGVKRLPSRGKVPKTGYLSKLYSPTDNW